MPGNEVGDRIHNFFGQENLSQGQHHSEVVDGAWPALGNNLWAGSQRQIGTPFISNLKNHSVQQSADSEGGHGGQSSSMQHGVNFSQSILRPEFARRQSQNQQPTLNGYMHGNQAFQTRQNDANFLGMDTEPDRHNLMSRGFSILDAPLGNAPELQKKNSARVDFNESPVNYDFLGGKQQMSSHHPGMLQSLPRQQSGIRDMQLIQQDVMLKQMQEIQRQQQYQKQQLQQQEVRQLNSVNQVSSFAKQTAGSHPSTLLNGIPIHDASNYSWQPELMPGNANWLQRGMSPVMQGSSGGLMFSPEHGQAQRLTGIIPQQVDQSLYGVPISGTRVAPSQYSPVQMDASTIQQISGSSNSFSGNQYAGFPDQASMLDGTLASRQALGTADSQGLDGGFNLENMRQVDPHQSNGPGQDFHRRQDPGGPSETSLEKTAMQVTTSQNVAALDPTEEKILFGTDDNLWEAFGRGTNVGSGGFNMLDGTDFLSAFPSVQSGSWSALMQSAVAETSSADTGVQEEWRGLTFRHSEPSGENQQTPTVNDSGKRQSTGVDNRLQGSMNDRPYSMYDGTNSSINCNNMPGVKQSGVNTSHEQSERLHGGSSKRYVQPFSGEENKWLDCNPLQKPVSEGSHNYGKGAEASDVESNAKSISDSWTNQQSISSYSNGSQPGIRPNGWKFIDSMPLGTGNVLKNQGNENTLQTSQMTELKSPMFEVMGYGAGTWKTDSVSNSIVELERSKSATGSPQVNREDSNLNNVAALPDSSTVRANEENSQQLPNGNNIDIWKNIGSSVNTKGREFPGKYQPHMDKSHQTLTGNNSLGNGAIETHDYPDTKESKTDSFITVSHHTSTSGAREKTWLDANDSPTLCGGKLKSSIHIGRKPSGVRKFQYHPMGDLDADVEPSYGTKHLKHSQSMPMQISQRFKGHDHGGIGQSKFPTQIARNSTEIDKLHFPGQGETKGLDGINVKNIVAGSAPSTSASFDRAVYTTSKATPSSQNMLELLHKVDQSRECGNATHFASSNCNQSSEMHDVKNSDGSVQLQQNQTSASQVFGFQLVPPSQPLPSQEHALSSQSPSQKNNSISSTCVTSEVGEKGHKWLASTTSVQGFPLSCEISQEELRNNICGISGQSGKTAQGNFSAALSPGFPYSRSHSQNQHMYDMGARATNSQSVNAYFDGFTSQSKQVTESFERARSGQSALASLPDDSRITSHNDVTSSGEMHQFSNNNQNGAKDSAQQFPVLEAVPALQGSNVSGKSQEYASARTSAPVWTNISTQQRSFGVQAFKASSNMFKPNIQSNNDAEATSSVPQKLEGHAVQMVRNGPSESGACSMNSLGFGGKEQAVKGYPCQQVSPDNDHAQKTTSVSEGKESAANGLIGTSLANPASTQREIEPFGRSLRPNNFFHENYSLMHQVQGTKNADVDPDNRSMKRFKGPDGAVDAQQVGPLDGQQLYGHNNMVRDTSTNCASSSAGDAKMLSILGRRTDVRDANALFQDTLGFGQNDSQNFANSSAVSVRTEHSQISPQMAPSWFDQYGAFKNGQILPLHDARRNVTVKTMELPFTVGRPSNSLHAHGPVEQENVIAADASRHSLLQKGSTPSPLSSPQLMHLDTVDVSLAAVRPKKRKSATSELLPWNKQVVHGLQRLQNISSAELEWAHAANRLPEKVEDETEMVEDRPPGFRSKRRLILTTQLMQLLFHPSLASVLSADAMSHYESVVHLLARSTLGDACSTLSCGGSETPVPSSSGNSLPEKLKTSERISNQYFSRVVEDLISRARKLENDILRLDKRTSVLDLRVECQELEKYSVINRFAKFHGRGQADGAETSSSSDATQKSRLQRYVTALPMPRNLPDGVQCFPL
ncbi:hypothetical protein P3X46_023194 [Hevea brasiliensis]|uniref:Uncharacterized protein n=1 Tax=Hevea brasiliensis TaxID=3981 RepID=A0ABQ9LC12_HEVBR|nr:uncharacterized protein LOC110636255 [Hevea brasiliensis]XP_021641593.2 uncharacterized protein LOC110636255 [Hevea brasiliensis]XP_057988387.1 uncharacterized protein LOC110636255 [Hevea brasiliensis]KAJ9163539.1 hypothetical protein P3X46_023194 [Hevea brasiliensis]